MENGIFQCKVCHCAIGPVAGNIGNAIIGKCLAHQNGEQKGEDD